jgi:hypothetical protein
MPLAPLDDPLSYPGPPAAWPFRLVGEQVHRLAADDPLLVEGDRHRADDNLVLAIGSNACPAQLARKFRNRPCRPDLVGFPVTVTGLQIRPSAHLGRSGYWPFAPIAGDDASSPAVLCRFDDEQLAVLDATEPNYDRIALDPHRQQVTALPDGLAPGSVQVYASRHGVVDDPRLPAWSVPAPSQQALLTALLPLLQQDGDAMPTSVVDAPTLSRALRSEDGLAARLTEVLKRTLVVRRWP